MSNPIKKLAGQTVIYGLGTILPRFLNYLLTPLLTYIFQKPVDYGVNSEMYAYIAFLNVVFTYGMETAFFNFSSKREDKDNVFQTALTSILLSSVVFSLLLFIFSGSIANWLEYPDKLNYVYWTILILATDAIMAIPFAKLRLSNQAMKFALIKAANVFVNIGLHIFFFVICKNAYEANDGSSLASFYDPQIGIGYAFLSNLLANLFSLLLLAPQFKYFRFSIDKDLWLQMLGYAWPLLVLGLAGMVNETFDRIIIKKLLPDEIGKHAQGIYGACYKISILMTVFIQAFRYAAEPFFFNNAKDKDSKKTYAFVMKVFVIFCSFLFLITMMNLPIIKYFVSEPYWEGLSVVPVLLIANLFLGVYFNLSIWYKLTGQTKYGASITIIGAIITLVINFIFVPQFSYNASAWATLAAYGSMAVISYFLGQKHYPIKYNVRAMSVFFILAIGFYFLSFTWQQLESRYIRLILNNLLVVLFVFLFYKLEFSNLKKFKTSSSANDQDHQPIKPPAS
ncbi:MAG: lipopolysaccharide biosynthesis protein [Sphingobacteriaceae bacterium]